MAKKKHRKQPFYKKWVRAGVNIAGTVLGTFVATSPLHRGIRDGLAGNSAQMVTSIRQDIGVAEGGAPDVTKLTQTAVTVVVGLGIISLFRYLARRV